MMNEPAMKLHSCEFKGRAQRGFSLVEIMVGMVISLIGVIIIFQVFQESEGIKRRTTGGGDAQQNGVVALFQMERSLKQAGYGLNSNDAAVVPVAITANAANTPDSVTVNYRRNWDLGPYVPTTGAPPAVTAETFSLNGAQLVSDNGTPADATDDIFIAGGIVQMKAQMNASNDAVQVVLTARSNQPEKPSVAGGACDTTAANSVSLAWTGGSVDVSGNIGLGAGDDWKCYRYKTFETTVPLRNVIWRP